MVNSKCSVTCNGLKRCDADFKKSTTLNYIFGTYGPDWYQAMSSSQMAAANSLHESVLEDLEQGTASRCDKCLRGIGIKPIERVSNLLLAVRQSKGNDIAFLWFLWQMFYTSERCNTKTITYTLNERLILSAIAHLDTITTLRQLDQQLPACPAPKRKLNTLKITHPIPVRTKYTSPYLEPLPVPKIPSSHQLPRPNLPPTNFAPYNEYTDPLFIVFNEESRWYVKNKYVVSSVDRSALLKELFSNKPNKVRHAMLLQQFTDAVRCNCSQGHQMSDIKSTGIVHKIELDNATKKKAFQRLAVRYQIQMLVRALTQQLIFGKNSELPNISVCINCPKCQRDFEMLKILMKYNKQCSHPDNSRIYSVDYDRTIGNFVFGSGDRARNAAQLLKKFNEMSSSIPINVCVKDLWQLELTLWTDQIALSSSPIPQVTTICACSLHPNPRDDVQMDRMLTNALTEMALNPKFVLASLPNVEKLPILREWIRTRYGLRYLRTERSKAMRRSVDQWTVLSKEKLFVRVPGTPDVRGTGQQLSYGDKNDVMMCIKRMNQNYYHRLAVTLVNDTRRFWPTMKPFHCANGAPTDVFYAYLPATEYAVMPYRPWAVHEFRDQVKVK